MLLSDKTKTMNTPETVIFLRPYHASCGDLMLGSYGGNLCLCDWQEGRWRERTARRLQTLLHARFEMGESDITAMAAGQLDEYFNGIRKTFDIPLLFVGTEFQKTVWNELLRIPYGQTIAYAELAVRLGKPSAVRAVANTNAANPLSIIVPCHRVIGTNHALTGYAGGLDVKRFLLRNECGNR